MRDFAEWLVAETIDLGGRFQTTTARRHVAVDQVVQVVGVHKASADGATARIQLASGDWINLVEDYDEVVARLAGPPG